jgi:hypothetical protein
MRSRSALLLTLALLAAGCDAVTGPGGPVTRISWGSSFGECVGYCRKQLDVTPTQLKVTEESWDQPPLVSSAPPGERTWTDLQASFAGSGFQGLQATYGCPDCADGGAEWVEVEWGTASKRVTFEFGHSPPPLAAAVTALRRILDEQFTATPFVSLHARPGAGGGGVRTDTLGGDGAYHMTRDTLHRTLLDLYPGVQYIAINNSIAVISGDTLYHAPWIFVR